jgi:hypothetical protein
MLSKLTMYIEKFRTSDLWKINLNFQYNVTYSNKCFFILPLIFMITKKTSTV